MATLALCIPAYNAATFLPQLIASAKNQQIHFNEILVYNDCSTDDTSIIAKELGAIVIDGKINMGCSYGKNELAKVAKSEWLHFHDADDLLLSNFSTVSQKWILKPETSDIVLLHFHYLNFETKQFLSEPIYNVNDLKDDAIKFNISNKVVNFALIRKNSFLKIGGFDTDPKVLYNEDRAFYTKAATMGLTFDYEPEVTCINYFHPKSMSSNNMSKCADASYNVWLKVIDKVNGNYKEEIAFQLMGNATYAAVANNWLVVKMSIKKAKSLWPTIKPVGSKLFLFVNKFLPFYSFYLREKVIIYFTNKR